jgi:intein/homing endonuclease
LSDLLKELGIKHANYSFQPKNDKHSKVFILVISEKEARKQFLDKIGFWHRRKETTLRQALGL